MNRWTFAGGLTVILLLLLTLSGFCMWATRGLTEEIGSLIDQNYDRIRAVRDLRSAVTRIDGHYLASKSPASLPDSREVFRQERDLVERRLMQLMAPTSLAGEEERVARLTAACQDYFASYEEMLGLRARDDERFTRLAGSLAVLSTAIAERADQIGDLNEAAIFARRDAAIVRGQRVTWIAVGFAVFSLGIYLVTSVRLARAVFTPLRRLRDSMQQVRDRRFDAVVPVEGGEELRGIVTNFNQMAGELRRYIEETDERALQASRTSRAILEALPYPVYITDREFSVRQTNPRAEALSAALGIPGALPGEVRRQIDQAAAKATAESVVEDVRDAVHLPLPAGDAVGSYFLPQVFRMKEADGRDDGWAVLLIDVTRLRRVDEAKTKALATLGHEVKTPVAGMRMSLHLLLEEKLGVLNPEQRELLQIGRDDCERLLTVLQALMELARLESGGTELRLTPQSPAELLEETVQMHAESARRAGCSLRIEPLAALPAVLAEPVYAGRVLGNFVTNACKYGQPGQPITLRAQSRGDGYVRLSVINQGRPLTDVEQARIFDPFFRRPGESAEGTGLGLAICREIGARHGGRVGVFCPTGEERVEFYLDLRVAPET